MADVDREVEFVGEPLKLGLPHATAVTVDAARIGGDEDLAGIGIARLADVLPPRLVRGDCESGRVVIDAHAHEAVVGCEVVRRPVRNRLADGVGGEVGEPGSSKRAGPQGSRAVSTASIPRRARHCATYSTSSRSSPRRSRADRPRPRSARADRVTHEAARMACHLWLPIACGRRGLTADDSWKARERQ
jgi:hypothetical protein